MIHIFFVWYQGTEVVLSLDKTASLPVLLSFVGSTLLKKWDSDLWRCWAVESHQGNSSSDACNFNASNLWPRPRWNIRWVDHAAISTPQVSLLRATLIYFSSVSSIIVLQLTRSQLIHSWGPGHSVYLAIQALDKQIIGHFVGFDVVKYLQFKKAMRLNLGRPTWQPLVAFAHVFLGFMLPYFFPEDFFHDLSLYSNAPINKAKRNLPPGVFISGDRQRLESPNVRPFAESLTRRHVFSLGDL